MTLSAESLTRLAGETGFRVEFIEKVEAGTPGPTMNLEP